MIADGDISVIAASGMLHTSRSTFQYVPREHARRLRSDEMEKRELIESLALENITYGYRRIWALMRRQGVFISRKRVRRIMREMGLQKEAHFPRPRLPQTGNLIADAPNTRWYTDITIIETTELGNCSFMEVEDACSREIVSWDFLPSFGAREALSVVEDGVMARFTVGRAAGLWMKTDGGSQYTSTVFRQGCSLLGIKLDSTRKRKPEDNGMIESLHGHFKNEYIFINEPMTFAETIRLIAEAVKHYNETRPHSSLGYLTPREYGNRFMEKVVE